MRIAGLICLLQIEVKELIRLLVGMTIEREKENPVDFDLQDSLNCLRLLGPGGERGL